MAAPTEPSARRSDPPTVPAAGAEDIPVMRPLLPPAEALLPYLRRMDTSRVYSNFGPLARELEERLAALLSLPSGAIVLAASGYAALAAAILAPAERSTTRCGARGRQGGRAHPVAFSTRSRASSSRWRLRGRDASSVSSPV